MRVNFLIILVTALRGAGTVLSLECSLSKTLKSEIRKYASIIDLIKRTVVDAGAPFKNTTWIKLANFVDDFGSRLAGTQNLENAIDFLLNELESAKLDNVHGENASVPHWVR